MTIEQRLNWQISAMRGWKKVDAGCEYTSLVDPEGRVVATSRHPEVLEEYEIDWHKSYNWPTLLLEFPKGTALVQAVASAPMKWLLCTCGSGTSLKICQPGSEPADVVCRAWIAYKLAPRLEEVRDAIAKVTVAVPMSPGPDTIN